MPEAEAFCHQLAEFLDIFGDRTGVGYGSDGTICVPTWREDPALVLRIVAPYLDPSVQAPALARAQAQADRDAAVEKVCGASDDQVAVAELRGHLAFGRRAAAVMEEHNHYIDQMMNGQLRQAIFAAARWLAEKGILTDEEDIFWLHYDEILAALRARSGGTEKGRATADVPASAAGAQENVADLNDIIFARKAQHTEWEKLDPPPLLGIPHVVLPRRTPLQDEVTPTIAEGNDRLRGLGASPGCGRGRARVVASSWSLPDLSPGDVLVAENVGPRWTPLIPMLSGLVLDGGAVGQHHAITAREYGVPAVVGTRNATRRIPDGAWVIVDGTAGTVDVQDAPQEGV
jgi:pyruvate,water dikinase